MRGKTIKILFKIKFNTKIIQKNIKKTLTLLKNNVKMYLEQKKPSTTGTC